MEEKPTQQNFKIPIEIFDEDMYRETAKEKKKEILEIFTSSNKICSEEEFEEIENNLHEACKEGDVELIKIYLSETIEDASKEFKFKIDKASRTASLFKINNENIHDVIIPRTIEYESIELLITSISGINENIKILRFVEDSSVKTIYRNAFSWSSIEEIYFPPSLKELKEGWCDNTEYLTKIIISPLNGQFIMKDDKYLLSKSDLNKDEFDILLFGSRNIEEISIPPNIKKISSCAFDSCYNLKKVEIPPNSNLQTIESFAFSYSKFEEIYLPTSLKNLNEGWCLGVDQLTKITISPSNGQFILKDGKYLVGKCDENSDEFDSLLFAVRDIKQISIPSNIKTISSCAFFSCTNLIKVEIPPNSNLQIIGPCAFSLSNIKDIFISSNVSKISEGAFSDCQNLTKVEISPNSNLQTIESYAFNHTNINGIFIPSKVKKIYKLAFNNCFNLQIVEISKESKMESFPLSAFHCCSKLIIMIPSSLKKIIQ